MASNTKGTTFGSSGNVFSLMCVDLTSPQVHVHFFMKYIWHQWLIEDMLVHPCMGITGFLNS